MRELEPSPRWVFLRGLARESAHWEDFPDRFAAGIPNGGVLLADLPGNGRHWRMGSPASIGAMMEFVRRDALDAGDQTSGPSRPCYLFAISLGAMVAFEWLQRHPGEIAGAVLVNTSLRGLSPLYHRLRWQAWPGLLSIACQRDIRLRERAILRLTSRHGADRTEWVESRVQAYRRHPISRLNLIRQLWAAATFRPSPQNPGTPLLLLNSLGDRLVNPACSQAISRQWGVGLSTHPWAGHDLPLDDPEWIIAEVLHWLQAHNTVELSRHAGMTETSYSAIPLRL
jgi:pimeloyl-ACP methyl ester carboxylesterase